MTADGGADGWLSMENASRYHAYNISKEKKKSQLCRVSFPDPV